MIHAALLIVMSQTPFPIPTLDNKPLAVTAEQKQFRLPMKFARVKEFYEQQFGQRATIKLASTTENGMKVLKISNKEKNNRWTVATVREGEMETVVEYVPVLSMGPLNVGGKGPPVQFIISRSAGVKAAIDSIDHTEHMRSR
jgi:hypothetical protein